MVALRPHYDAFIKTLPPPPVDRRKLDDLVSKVLDTTRDKVSADNFKPQWEYVLRNDILTLAAAESKVTNEHNTKYYDVLCGKLDLALTFTEQNACEQTFPFNVLQDLLETQTIASCSHIFSWIESRAGRLTQGMVPQKGKALVLLRTLNDLLRRLSRMGNTTIFCGRILTFLSGVFPLGERSGVNLRGDYGPTWEGVTFPERERSAEKEKDEAMKVDGAPPAAGPSQEQKKSDDKMDVDVKKLTPKPAEVKAEFYNTFWSLQLPFSKPPVFANKGTFEEFKESLARVLPVIKEATAKERAMMGSRNGSGSAATLKRKRESEEETNTNEYFFAKFLTSPELLDLEIADTHFRRQFLLQLLILLHHLQNFTKAAKAVWPTQRNRSLQIDFTLEDEDAQWVSDTTNKVLEELRQTTPNGRVFAETVNVILERDKNWVKWKNELCTAFDKEPWAQEVDGVKVGLFESTKPARDKMREPPADWKWNMGTEPLTEIWDMGYTSLMDLQMPFHPGDVKDFVKKIKLEDSRIALRRQRLEKLAKARAAAAARAAPAPAPAPPVPAVVVPTEPTPKPEPVDSSQPALVSPRPVSAANMLHPSLPPKPSTPGKPNQIQEPPKPAPSPNMSARTPAATPAVQTPPATAPTPAPAPPPIVDEEIARYEESKQLWAWLALRTARDQYLQHFGKIGTGDIELLAQEIEKEKAQVAKGEEPLGGQGGEDGPHTDTSPPATAVKEGDGDIKMEAT